MIINCHIREYITNQHFDGTDFTLPGSTEDRYTYTYSYDSFGRLTQSERFEGSSNSATNTFSEKNLSFDGNGNILSLTRYGNGNSDIKDNFTYFYSGNRIERLLGTYNGSAITHTEQNNQVSGTANYIYDDNGNMTLDALRNITLTYDINNLVSTVSRNDTLLSTYFYLADGTKYKVIDKDNKGRVYIGPFSYALEKIGNTVYSYLEGIDTDGGRIMVLRKQNGNQTTADYTTAFFVKDHLGSTRVMLNAQGDILERNAYYPFGLQMNQGKAYPTLTERLPQLYSGYISPTSARRDLYNGKEIQSTAGTDYLDYGFRQYDPVTARWMAVDPKAEKYLSLTPYNFCAGNSLSIFDLKGDTIVAVSKISGARLINEIHNTFQGEKFKNLNALFKLNKDRQTMASIDKLSFESATKDLNNDKVALATAYFNAINDEYHHYVDMTKREESLNTISKLLSNTNYRNGKDVDDCCGGGVNYSLYNNDDLSIIVINSRAEIDYVYSKNRHHYNRLSTPAELLSHEMLGHGLSRSKGYSNTNLIAIQMTNLYWRVRGYNNFYRDGTNHKDGPFQKEAAIAIPLIFNCK